MDTYQNFSCQRNKIKTNISRYSGSLSVATAAQGEVPRPQKLRGLRPEAKEVTSQTRNKLEEVIT